MKKKLCYRCRSSNWVQEPGGDICCCIDCSAYWMADVAGEFYKAKEDGRAGREVYMSAVIPDFMAQHMSWAEPKPEYTMDSQTPDCIPLMSRTPRHHQRTLR